MRRVRLDHLVEEQVLTIHIERDLARPALLDRLGEINRQRFARVIEQVLDEFDTPGERVRIAAVQVALGSFAPDDLHRAEARLRERLRAALAVALKEVDGTMLREREGRALVTAFEHYLLHGTWPIGNAIALDTLPADLLAQLIAEDPLALVAMLRRRGSSDALLRRLVQQMPDALLAALLHRLEPVHAAYVLAYLGEVRERHAAERLIPASPAQLAEMLWTIVLRDALQELGLQANRKAFLLRLLRQLARSGGTTLAALIVAVPPGTTADAGTKAGAGIAGGGAGRVDRRRAWPAGGCFRHFGAGGIARQTFALRARTTRGGAAGGGRGSAAAALAAATIGRRGSGRARFGDRRGVAAPPRARRALEHRSFGPARGH